jgi:hypothetical protein
MKNNLKGGPISNDLHEFHEGCVSKLKLPSWVCELQCPYCKEKLTPFSIRGLTFKTNVRNMGDLCIDFLCEKCSMGDYLYIRHAFESLDDMLSILNGQKCIDPKLAIVEQEMYNKSYNNSLEKLLGVTNGNS